MYTTPSSAARAAPRTRAAASRPASAADPEGLHRSTTPSDEGQPCGRLREEQLRSRLTPDMKPMGKSPLADASLDRRLQNAYKSPRRGEALHTRGATTTPGARAARRGASVRRTPRCTRRDCHADLRNGRRPHPLRGGWLLLPTAGLPRWVLELPR